ncbi:MAG: flagellar accessory protein FlaH [Chloroflexi bacterium]|nr:flagellar accessory protein FlaH [Chloroflexota bacterium]MCI0790433.1 flagellar accessory protein FlaH [Chloroflexota bacterium]MCI0868506.1 flagellar accessory protein FlaH [Chloroflexota bacterium]
MAGSLLDIDEVEDQDSLKPKVISTGNTEVDKKMGGGIPVGSLILIEGESDAGKSVLTQQMIWGSLYDGINVVLYTTENTVKSFIRQMNSLSLEVTDFLLLGKLKIFSIMASKAQLSPAEVFSILLTDLESYPGTPLIVVDSLTTFITHSSIEETMTFFEICKQYCDRGTTVIMVVNSYAFGEADLARVRSICDAHLSLRNEEVGDRLIKVLEVAKVRGAQMSTGNIISFDVEPMLGIKIIPVSKVSV